MIVSDDIASAKSNPNNQYINLTLEVVENMAPEFKGRKFFDMIHLWNANQKAVDIANRTLKSICIAVGHGGILHDTEALHRIPMAVKIGTRPAEGQYAARNEVKGYEPLASRFPEFAGATAPPPPPPPATGQVGGAAGATVPPQGQTNLPGQDASSAKPPWQQ